jgi:hypothetical protein
VAALEPREPARRYNRARAGELIHLDTKKLARFTPIGHRITGDRHGQNNKVGWEFVHVAVDDASRLAYVEATSRACSARPAGCSACATSEPNPTRPRPTARPSASSRPCCANGPNAMPYRSSDTRAAETSSRLARGPAMNNPLSSHS